MCLERFSDKNIKIIIKYFFIFKLPQFKHSEVGSFVKICTHVRMKNMDRYKTDKKDFIRVSALYTVIKYYYYIKPFCQESQSTH